MAVVDVDDDGVVLPFADSILARDLMTAGMPTGGRASPGAKGR